MRAFANLLDRLAFTPQRNGKLTLLRDFMRDTPDPERGWALAALTGALTFKHAKGGTIRALIAERTDPVLFALSYDYVGDLSETVALMWPADPARHGWIVRCSHCRTIMSATSPKPSLSSGPQSQAPIANRS